MTKNYDFVVTSGGIGPTHDGEYLVLRGLARSRLIHACVADITYASLAKAFELPLKHDPEVLKRMMDLATEARREELSKASPAQKEARERMALFPTSSGNAGEAKSEVIFVESDKWVPVVRLGGKVSPSTGD
jgi:hypothetical protein